MQKTWQVAGGVSTVDSLEDLRALLLKLRGVEGEAGKAFFEPNYARDIHDPLTLHEMDVAVERIYRAIENQESIVVHGDYDADGITSTAILVSVLQDLGAHVTPFLPHRSDDGYGLNQANLEALQEEMNLLITCDCGISNAVEIAWLKSQGIDTIVIDHHELPSDLPAAVAIVHPGHQAADYAWPQLCGAGTAWKVASALLRDEGAGSVAEGDAEKWLLDLAALGTVADLVPLKGENRAIVAFGLEIIRRTRRPGLAALLAAGRAEASQVTSDDMAFNVIPVLNAAGRLDHPQPALELLLTHDVQRAAVLTRELTALNNRRRTLTKKIVSEAEAQVNGDPVIFAYNSRWPAGIVGLAAGRLADRFGRPAVVVGSSGSAAVGSARAPGGTNILELLRQAEPVLTKLGGHAQAAGFSLTEANVAGLRETLAGLEVPAANLNEAAAGRADAVVSHELLTPDTAHLLESFAPFGEGNKRPRFALMNLALVEAHAVGAKQEHAKLTFDTGSSHLDGIAFGLAEQVSTITQPEVDVLGELVEDQWRGRRRLQLQVRDIVPSGSVKLVA